MRCSIRLRTLVGHSCPSWVCAEDGQEYPAVRKYCQHRQLSGPVPVSSPTSFTSNNKIDAAADVNLSTATGSVSSDEGSNLDRLSQSPLVQSDLVGNSGWKLSKLNIEDIQVGMRVPALNPLEEEIENESIDRETWRKVRLKMNRGNGSEMQITLLRSEAWIRESLVLANGLSALDRNAIGQRIEFNVDELNAAGFAEILSVEPCPEIIDGPGEVVTATYHSKSVPVIDLHIAGLSEPLGVTHDHPIWSEDRHDFVKAGELQAGETMQLIDDQLVRLTNIEPRAGPEDVFNFEVANQHVYFVGDGGLLVHNAFYFRKFFKNGQSRLVNASGRFVSEVAVFGSAVIKTGKKVVSWAIDKHHAIPKFLGGHAKGMLYGLSKPLHNKLHGMIRSGLKKAGFAKGNGGLGLNSSTDDWIAEFAKNPGSKRKAWDAMMDASRKFDKEHGTTVTNAIWKEIYGGMTKF